MTSACKTAANDKPALIAVPARTVRREKPHVLDRNRAYGVAYYPNPNSLVIHTNRQLVKTCYQNWNGNKKYAPQIFKELKKTPGIDEVSVYPYQIRINKHELFVWETLEPKILKIFLKHFQKGKQPAKRVYNHFGEFTTNSPRPNAWR